MMKVLVTAFAPFAGASSNSSELVARELSQLDWSGKVEFKYPLPVTFAGAFPSLGDVTSHDAVLALGQAEGRRRISLERVALNFADASVADNSGFQPKEEKIVEGGPEIFWCPLPWPEFSRPENVELSYSAGTFVCNALFYRMLAHKLHAGFVHIPLLEQQEGFAADLPRLKKEEAVRSFKSILEFLVRR